VFHQIPEKHRVARDYCIGGERGQDCLVVRMLEPAVTRSVKIAPPAVTRAAALGCAPAFR